MDFQPFISGACRLNRNIETDAAPVKASGLGKSSADCLPSFVSHITPSIRLIPDRTRRGRRPAAGVEFLAYVQCAICRPPGIRTLISRIKSPLLSPVKLEAYVVEAGPCVVRV